MNESVILAQNGMNYVENYLSHYGKGHDDNPPGRGSGRYAWNSGKKNDDVDSKERKQKAFTQKNLMGREKLSKAGKEHYGFEDAVTALRKRDSFINHHMDYPLDFYNLEWYRAKGADGFRGFFRNQLLKNPEMKKAMDDLVDFFDRIKKDEVEVDQDEVIKQMYLESAYRDRDEKLRKLGLKHSSINYVDDYIAHYGRSKLDGAPVGSGAHPLGSGADPYQDYPELREAHKKKGISGALEKIKQHGEQKKAVTSLKKDDGSGRSLEERKDELLRSNDVKSLIANQDLFTVNELQNALERADKVNKLSAYVPKEKTIVNKIDSAFGVVGKATKWINTGVNFVKAVNSVKDVVNLSSDDTKKKIVNGQEAANKALNVLGEVLSSNNQGQNKPKQKNSNQGQQNSNQKNSKPNNQQSNNSKKQSENKQSSTGTKIETDKNTDEFLKNLDEKRKVLK